jgi:hypothetical protein
MYLFYSTLNRTLNRTLNSTLNTTLNSTLNRTLNKNGTSLKPKTNICNCIHKEVFCCFHVPFGFCKQGPERRYRKEKKNKEDMKTTTNLFINAVATAFSEYTAFGAIESQYIKGVGVICPSG